MESAVEILAWYSAPIASDNYRFALGPFDYTWIRLILCVESIHDRSIKRENQFETIQREWIDSTAGLWISS